MVDDGARGLKVKAPGFELSVSEKTLAGCVKPIIDAYGFIEDWMADRRALVRTERLARYRARSIKVLLETQKLLEAQGMSDPVDPPDKLLELAGPAIAVEDDATLQKLWANLLASAMDPSSVDDVSGLAAILKDMPAEAARTFATLANAHMRTEAARDFELQWHIKYSVQGLYAALKGQDFNFDRGLDHLLRLQVFEPVLVPSTPYLPLPVLEQSEVHRWLRGTSSEDFRLMLDGSIPDQALRLTSLGEALLAIAEVRDDSA